MAHPSVIVTVSKRGHEDKLRVFRVKFNDFFLKRGAHALYADAIGDGARIKMVDVPHASTKVIVGLDRRGLVEWGWPYTRDEGRLLFAHHTFFSFIETLLTPEDNVWVAGGLVARMTANGYGMNKSDIDLFFCGPTTKHRLAALDALEANLHGAVMPGLLSCLELETSIYSTTRRKYRRRVATSNQASRWSLT